MTATQELFLAFRTAFHIALYVMSITVKHTAIMTIYAFVVVLIIVYISSITLVNLTTDFNIRGMLTLQYDFLRKTILGSMPAHFATFAILSGLRILDLSAW